MKTGAKQVLSFMNIISWIVFIGLCIKTGAILYSFFVSLVINPEGSKNLHLGLNLSALYRYNTGHYAALVSFILVLSVLKAWLFYLVIKIFLKLNLVQPFSEEVSKLIAGISHVALEIGIITLVATSYCERLMKKGVDFPDMQSYLGGAAEFLLLGGIIFIIAEVFKRGIEIQSENELTV